MDAYSGDLAFLPLGGTGEIGMNLNLYRASGKWLAIDCGIGFGGQDNPEVEIMMPDPGFIADRRDAEAARVAEHELAVVALEEARALDSADGRSRSLAAWKTGASEIGREPVST